MFTIENDTDNGEGSTIVTLDNSGQYDDVEVILFDDVVYIRQVDEHDHAQLIIMAPMQFRDIIAAWNLPDGSYVLGK
jgi:hypothetical protein